MKRHSHSTNTNTVNKQIAQKVNKRDHYDKNKLHVNACNLSHISNREKQKRISPQAQLKDAKSFSLSLYLVASLWRLCVCLSESVFVCLSVTGVSASDCGLNSWASRRRKTSWRATERQVESGPLPMMSEKHLTFDYSSSFFFFFLLFLLVCPSFSLSCVLSARQKGLREREGTSPAYSVFANQY